MPRLSPVQRLGAARPQQPGGRRRCLHGLLLALNLAAGAAMAAPPQWPAPTPLHAPAQWPSATQWPAPAPAISGTAPTPQPGPSTHHSEAVTTAPQRSGAPAAAAPAAELPRVAGPAVPSSPAQAAAAPGPSWPSLTELLALPDWLGLTLTLNAAPIANPSGGLTSAANWMQQNELNLNAGTGRSLAPAHWRREIDHWQARLRLDAYNGQSTFGSTIGSLFAPQTVAYTPGLYLSGASVLRSSRDQSLRVSAGYQSLDQDFLVAPSYTSYLYSGFNDTLNLTIPGLPITPFAAPSLVVHWRSRGLGDWRVGAYWLDQETELAGLFGAPAALTRDLRGSLQVLQWDLPLWTGSPTLRGPLARRGGGTVARQLPAPLLQLGAFRTTSSFTAAVDSPTGRSDLRNHVLYSSLTLPARLPLGLDHRLWVSVQWGLNPSENITPLFLAGGWQCQGPFSGRPLDVLSLGLGRTSFSPQLLPGFNWAGAVELNYTLQINNRLSLQPVLQWLLRPSGEGTVPAIVTTALQLSLSL